MRQMIRQEYAALTFILDFLLKGAVSCPEPKQSLPNSVTVSPQLTSFLICACTEKHLPRLITRSRQ